MFQEDIAQLTADHLRIHIRDNLEYIESRFPNDPIKLVFPKSIECASVVGGLFKDFDRILPAYAIDVWGKAEAITIDNLNTYEYMGQVSGLIAANNRTACDKLVKRHAAAVELFIRTHEFLHEMNNDYFRIIGFLSVDAEFSGAEQIAETKSGQVWIAGFSFDCVWTTSEAAVTQHA